MDQPPNLKPLVGSSVGPPGACMTPSMETMAPTIIFRMGHSPCLSPGRPASDPTCSHLNVLASGAVCTACEIRSSIRFRERMIEAAGFVQMKRVGSWFQCDVRVDVLAEPDLARKVRDAERLLSEDAKEALDLVQPRRARRRVVEVHARILREPLLHLRRAVRRRVVEHH